MGGISTAAGSSGAARIPSGPPTSSLPIHSPSVIAAIAIPTTTSGTPIQVNRLGDRPSSDASTGSVSTERASASGEGARVGEPAFGIGVERSRQDAVERPGDVGTDGPGRGSTPGGFAREELEEQRRDRVDVRARVGFGPGELLGGEMLVAEQRPRPRSAGSRRRPRRSRSRSGTPARPRRRSRRRGRARGGGRPRSCASASAPRAATPIRTASDGDAGPARVEPFAQARAGRVLADEVDDAVLLAGIEQAGDPRHRQPRHAPSLLRERPREPRVVRETWVDQLHGHRSSQQRILRPPHHPGPAPAELLLERVAAGEDVDGLDRLGHGSKSMPGGTAPKRPRRVRSVARRRGRAADRHPLEVVQERDPPDDERVGADDEHDGHLAPPDVDPLETHGLVGVGDRVQGRELRLLLVAALPRTPRPPRPRRPSPGRPPSSAPAGSNPRRSRRRRSRPAASSHTSRILPTSPRSSRGTPRSPRRSPSSPSRGRSAGAPGRPPRSGARPRTR